MKRALLTALALAACTGPSLAVPTAARVVLPPRPEARIVLVGDTGKPGRQLRRVVRAIRAEEKDLVVALGDLVYPVAPRCRSGKLGRSAERELDRKVGRPLLALGAPVLLVLGNHDVGWPVGRNPAREACFLAYAAKHPRLHFPALGYAVNLGVALLRVVNTNELTAEEGRAVKRELAGHEGWRIVLGHHVLKTFHDKARQDFVRPWLAAHDIRPDLYVNGHAHFLQFGIYGDVPAVTSGSGSKLRRRPSCPTACGPGQTWGRSVPGYAVLHLTQERMEVVFKDDRGRELYRWGRDR